jgi:hypothetical protein
MAKVGACAARQARLASVSRATATERRPLSIIRMAPETLRRSKLLDFGGAVTGAGTDTISGASTLEFDSTLASTQTIDFTGSGGTLVFCH